MECDHCFVYSGPKAKGTFTLNQLRRVFNELKKIGTVEWVYFEGGEPFLFYPLMIEGTKIANNMGFKAGVVTNSYWAISDEDAKLWLKPLRELHVSDISISDDSFHQEDEGDNPAKRALRVAKRLGMPVGSICIEKPRAKAKENQTKGAPVIGGGALFRGRAVEKLVKGLPKKNWGKFTECPYEELKNPKRVHLDSFGNVHICQGLSMGNMWRTPLSRMVRNYNADLHPICGPLVKGGPALLAKKYKIKHEAKYVDACHFCYCLRRALLNRFPQYLGPGLVYGLQE